MLFRNHRSLAVALACLFLVSRLAGSVHLVLVQHNLCPDDGELVHPEEVHERAPGPGLGQAISPETLQEGCECADNHEHDHCLSAAQRDERSLRQSSAQAAAPRVPPAQDTQRPLIAHRSPKSLRIFRFAPKHSPPV